MALKICFLVIISLLVMLFLGVVSGIENPISLITDKMTDEMADNLISQSYVPYYPDKSKMDYKRPNLFIGGILQWSPNADYADPMQTGFADQNGAIYIPTYYSTKTTLDSTGTLDIIEVNKAANSEATDLNGLTRSELGANGPRTYGTIIGYSGGTTTVIEAMANQGVKADTLILISPMTGNLINGNENFEKKIQAILTQNPNIKIVAIQSPDDHGVLDIGQYDFVSSKFDNEEFKDKVQIVSKKGLNHGDIFRIYAMNNIKNGKLVDPNINVLPMPEPNMFQKFTLLVTNALEYIKTTLISYVPDSILTWISPWIDINPKTSSPTIGSWNKTFGDGSSFSSAQQTSDGGYIATGSKRSWIPSWISGNDIDLWLVKTDAYGNKLWDKSFGGLPGTAVGHSVQQTNDGGYIVIGVNGVLIKTDANGNTQWKKTSDGMGYSIRQTRDGGYIRIIGSHTAVEDYVDDPLSLIKTDPNANMLWRKTFVKYDCNNYGYSVKQTNDGGYVIIGSTCLDSWPCLTDPCTDTRDAWLIKIDKDGNEQWNRTFGGSGYDEAYSIIQTDDGGYILVGYTEEIDERGSFMSPGVWLIKTDAKGNKIWGKPLGINPTPWGFYSDSSLLKTDDNGYITIGMDNGKTALIKTDANGNKLWGRSFGGSNKFWGKSVQQTSDGGYIVAGFLDPGSDATNAWLIKTDAHGNEVTPK